MDGTTSDREGAMRLDHTGYIGTPYYDALCPACASPLIQALKWVELSERHWGLHVHCPECRGAHDLVLDDEQMHDFVLASDEATRSLVEVADYLDKDIFKDSCESFARALREGRIVPADF